MSAFPARHLRTPAFLLLIAVSVLQTWSGLLIAESSSPAPIETEFVYEAIVEIEAPVEVGKTPLGQRRFIPITGGTFEGPKLKGDVIPGGADWQLSHPNGATEVDALYAIRMDDGTVVIVRNTGLISEQGGYMKTALRFEAPEGPHEWLNKYQFVSSIAGGPRPGTVIIRVFRVL
ncbi:DUF3237 family protein [Pelagicoccus sp. SDUM812003]|uniref:DUF3237 family protein n=1 Tax=Pelagicoccus sp. SDUM812003 TaxID=3041267 RepID=UPI00280F0354|nr:DUF3237 family protein [Pelagicoccus sp. SDUM812003]MDQ8203486.1 DUF3237 family protein [Pelagicoccus sp. SDUM812003]